MMPPGAWYDLSSRVSAALSVTSCIGGALPIGRDSGVDINHIGNLAAAVQDLLMLVEQDLERLERQLLEVNA
mgnify:CR=1 FL=1